MVNFCAVYLIFLVSLRMACSASSEALDVEPFELNRACDDNWHLYGKYCYVLEGSYHEGRLSWENASARCSSMGGHLASIHSEKQNEFLTNYMKWNTAFAAWIGLHDRRTEYVYEWVDGSVLDYENWLIQQSVARLPNNNDCVEILYRPSQRKLRIFNVHGKWDDALCASRKAYICQKELNKNVSDDEDEQKIDTDLPDGTSRAILVGVYLSVSFWMVFFAVCAYHKRTWINERCKKMINSLRT